MRRFIFVFVTTFGLWLLLVPSTQAHVVVSDKRSGTTVLLHTTPADDPIAGQKSRLYLDINYENQSSRVSPSNLLLSVTDPQGIKIPLPFTLSESTIIAEYVFPEQGLYNLNLRSPSEYPGTPIALDYSVRINRGAAKPDYSPPLWSNILLIFGISGLAGLMIIGINNRYAIAHNSRF